MLRALVSASCDITHETGVTSFYGYWVLRLVKSLARQGVRFVMCIGFCFLLYHSRDRGYDLIRAFGSASCDITHETGGTICYEHWVLPLVISHARQGSICYGHWVLRLVISHTRQGGTICYGHWILPLAISHTRKGCTI